MDGSPALVPTPGGAGKFMYLGLPGVVAVALAGGCHGLGAPAVETVGAVASAATEMQPARSRVHHRDVRDARRRIREACDMRTPPIGGWTHAERRSASGVSAPTVRVGRESSGRLERALTADSWQSCSPLRRNGLTNTRPARWAPHQGFPATAREGGPGRKPASASAAVGAAPKKNRREAQ